MALLQPRGDSRQGSVLLIKGGSGAALPYTGTTDVARGAALSAALADAAAGDTVLLGSGTFDMGATLMGTPPAITIQGHGASQTTVKGPNDASPTPFLTITDGLEVRRLRFDTNRHVGVAGGASAVLRDLVKVGMAGISTGAGFGTVRLYECRFNVTSHALSVASTGVLECYGCHMSADAQGIETVSTLHAVAGGATIRYFGGEILGTNGVLGTQAISASNGGSIECFGTCIRAIGGTGTPKDANVGSGSTVRFFGCQYDAAKIFGAGTFVGSGPTAVRDLNNADPVADNPTGLTGEIAWNSNNSLGNAGFYGRSATAWVQLG